jgi:hypothetical protein
VTNLRAALAKDRVELERSYPRTADALDALEDNWLKQFREFFDGITVDPRHARQVSALLPAALRGLYAERTFGSHLNIDDALVGLREAITLYMTPKPAPQALGRIETSTKGAAHRQRVTALETEEESVRHLDDSARVPVQESSFANRI